MSDEEQDFILKPGWEKENILMMVPYRLGPAKIYRYFNPNLYPERVERLLHAAEDRWALMLTYAFTISGQITADTEKFLELLKKHIAVGPTNISADLKFVAVFQSATWPALFHGFLGALKSMLDVMGTSWALIADPNANIRGFRKGSVSGQNLAGVKLAKWFRNACPKAFSAAGKAAETIEHHSEKWITEVVAYRDTIMHYGDISGLTPLAVRMDIKRGSDTVPVGRFREDYTKDEVMSPRMPEGMKVHEYCRTTVANTERFLLEMAKLFASKESRITPGPPVVGDRFYISEELLKKPGAGAGATRQPR
jgi:hypothetical protein